MADYITNGSPADITPELIRDVLNLSSTDQYGIFANFANSVEQSLNLQETVDSLIEEMDIQLNRSITDENQLTGDLLSSATMNSNRTVREAVVNLGTSFGARQKEELSACFNLLNNPELSMAVKYVDVSFYDQYLYNFFKSTSGLDVTKLKDYFKASKFLTIADMTTPRVFDIGVNYNRMLFSSNIEYGEFGVYNGTRTTALRNFPTDIVSAIRDRVETSTIQQDYTDILTSIISDFGARSLNDLTAPFCSLVSIEMSTEEQAAFIDNYKGSIVIKLHDIQLMPVIQALLTPNRTIARVTFGWNHPNKNTIVGAIMNLKQTIDLMIFNYSIKFEENFEAEIRLEFRSAAVESIYRQTFLRGNAPVDGTSAQSINDRMGQLTAQLDAINRGRGAVLERLGSATEFSRITTALEASTSVQAFMALMATEADQYLGENFQTNQFSAPVRGLSPAAGGQVADTNEIFETINRIKRAAEIASLINEQYLNIANQLVTSTWESGSVRKLRERAEQENNPALLRTVNSFRFSEESSRQDRLTTLQRALGQNRSENGFEDEYAPLSELLNNFIFSPLYSGPNIDLGSETLNNEIYDNAGQTGVSNRLLRAIVPTFGASVIYFRANPNCGLFAQSPIGSFLISKTDFTEVLTTYIKDSGRIDITILDLFNSILSKIFSRQNDINYGLTSLFTEDDQIRSDIRTVQTVAEHLSRLDIDPELRGKILLSFNYDNQGNVLDTRISGVSPKMIAYDRRAFTADRFSENNVVTDTTLISENLDMPSRKIFFIYDENETDDAYFRIENEILNSRNISISSNENLTAEQKIMYKKEAARKLYPIIKLRKHNNSIVEKASVELGGGDAQLETILLTAQDFNSGGSVFQAPNTSSNKQGNRFYFARYPKVSLTVLGLPRLQKHQYVFLDMDSNTNMDNIYFVQNIKHNIDANGFTTSFDLTYNDAFNSEVAQRSVPSYEEADALARGNEATNRFSSATEEFDSRTFNALQFATYGALGDNISFSSSDLRRIGYSVRPGRTYSALQFATYGALGDNMRINDINQETSNERNGIPPEQTEEERAATDRIVQDAINFLDEEENR